MKKQFLLALLVVSGCYSYAQKTPFEHKRSDRKIIEISKIISLTEQQEQQIRTAYDEYNILIDSSLFKVQDAASAVLLKYKANKNYNEVFMNVLTDEQRARYIEITSAPEVNEKAKYKADLLAESNEYSQKELQDKKNEIFNYLMAEKIVYARDKFNIKKQKENIRKLKHIEPGALKESNLKEKIKAQGRISRGNVNW